MKSLKIQIEALR